MPYASDKQRGYMHVHHPKIAAKWDKEMNDGPEHFDKAVEKRLEEIKHLVRWECGECGREGGKEDDSKGPPNKCPGCGAYGSCKKLGAS